MRIKHLKTIILHGVTGMYNQNECLSIRWGKGKKARMTALWCRATIRVERPFVGKSRTGLAIHIHDGLVEFLLTAGLGRFALGLGVCHYIFERKLAFFELLALAGIEAGITVGYHLFDR